MANLTKAQIDRILLHDSKVALEDIMKIPLRLSEALNTASDREKELYRIKMTRMKIRG